MFDRSSPALDWSHIETSPGLLISVRDAEEAATALAAGADVIDVKEPDRGSLGAADYETIQAVVSKVAGIRPVTAALGELADLIDGRPPQFAASKLDGVSLFKIGLAQCGRDRRWREKWRQTISHLARSPRTDGAPGPVAVAYADWKIAEAPNPVDVLQTAAEIGCPALLVDTWNKSHGTLFDSWDVEALREFVDDVHRRSMRIVLAGSLRRESVSLAVALQPDLIAVRGAACRGDRHGIVCGDCVREIKRMLGNYRTVALP